MNFSIEEELFFAMLTCGGAPKSTRLECNDSQIHWDTIFTYISLLDAPMLAWLSCTNVSSQLQSSIRCGQPHYFRTPQPLSWAI